MEYVNSEAPGALSLREARRSLATTLISRCRVEKLGEVLHEISVDHVSRTLKLVCQSTVHVYRRNLPGLSCPQRLSGQFFANEDLGNFWRLED